VLVKSNTSILEVNIDEIISQCGSIQFKHWFNRTQYLVVYYTHAQLYIIGTKDNHETSTRINQW